MSPREGVNLGLDARLEGEQHAGAALRVGRGPARKGHRRRLHRRIDLGRAGEGDSRLNGAGVGVEHVAPALRGARSRCAGDDVLDRARARGADLGHGGSSRRLTGPSMEIRAAFRQVEDTGGAWRTAQTRKRAGWIFAAAYSLSQAM
jgi:hypothetical protein